MVKRIRVAEAKRGRKAREETEHAVSTIRPSELPGAPPPGRMSTPRQGQHQQKKTVNPQGCSPSKKRNRSGPAQILFREVTRRLAAQRSSYRWKKNSYENISKEKEILVKEAMTEELDKAFCPPSAAQWNHLIRVVYGNENTLAWLT